AYFTTIDSGGNNAYPYVIGPNYYGVVDTSDTANTVTIPGAATKYTLGDFNLSSTADSADYVLWRKQPDTQSDYNTWRSHFGATSTGSAASSNVPEPTALLLVMTAAAFPTLIKPIRRRTT